MPPTFHGLWILSECEGSGLFVAGRSIGATKNLEGLYNSLEIQVHCPLETRTCHSGYLVFRTAALIGTALSFAFDIFLLCLLPEVA